MTDAHVRPAATSAGGGAQHADGSPGRGGRWDDDQSTGQVDEEGIGSGDAAQRLAFRARALAQAHPLSDLARRFVDRAVATQRLEQPLPEIGIWAGAALVAGYCLRRVEETGPDGAPASERPAGDDLASEPLGRAPGGCRDLFGGAVVPRASSPAPSQTPHPGTPVSAMKHAQPDELRRLDERATELAAMVRCGETASFALAEPRVVEAALDRLVHSAVTARLQHWADDIDEAAWDELAEYLTWWTVKGYAMRVAEVARDGTAAACGRKAVGR